MVHILWNPLYLRTHLLAAWLPAQRSTLIYLSLRTKSPIIHATGGIWTLVCKKYIFSFASSSTLNTPVSHSVDGRDVVLEQRSFEACKFVPAQSVGCFRTLSLLLLLLLLLLHTKEVVQKRRTLISVGAQRVPTRWYDSHNVEGLNLQPTRPGDSLILILILIMVTPICLNTNDEVVRRAQCGS